MERIHAQLRDRIREALEMAALELMVELRRHHRRPAPDTANAEDRKEFEETARTLLIHLRAAFHTDLNPAQRAALERAEAAAADEAEALLAGQVALARELPDYWQRFEDYRTAHARARLDAPPGQPGWLSRLFGR